MGSGDHSRYWQERAGEVAAPLVVELSEALEIDLYEDGARALRVLSDFATRMYHAGAQSATTEVTAQFIEALPPGINVTVHPTAAPWSGALGEGPEWDGWEPSSDPLA